MNMRPGYFVPQTLGIKANSNEKHKVGLEILDFYKKIFPDNPTEQFLQVKL
jgi:hypothetical protein